MDMLDLPSMDAIPKDFHPDASTDTKKVELQELARKVVEFIWQVSYENQMVVLYMCHRVDLNRPWTEKNNYIIHWQTSMLNDYSI